MTAAEDEHYAALMLRAQQGDAEAYERCLIDLTVVLRGYVRARAGDVTWCDDVVQETLLSLHQARHTYDSRRSFAAWFYAIARHRLIDAVRRARRLGGRETHIDVVPEPSTAAIGHTERGPLERALARLPPRQRQVITAMKVHGESTREVATRTGMSESAVKVTAHRGYKALRDMLNGSRNHE